MIEAPAYRLDMTEAQFQALVVETARTLGWHVTHVRNMLGNRGGIPDLLCFRGAEYCLLELKTERGKLSRVQQRWHDDLAACGGRVLVVRPSDWERLVEELR